MIIGTGCDLVAHDRIATLLTRFGARFANKILTHDELQVLDGQRYPVNFIAKRFAAKEAFAKAMGTGFRDGLSLKHIGVVNNDLGAPALALSGKAALLAEQKGIRQIWLSLSDEKNMSLAMVICQA